MRTHETARTGLQASAVSQAVSAHNVSNANTDGFAKQTVVKKAQDTGGVKTQVDTVSLSKEAQEIATQTPGPQNNVNVAEEQVQQIQSRHNFEQNANVIRTQDKIDKTTLDMLG